MFLVHRSVVEQVRHLEREGAAEIKERGIGKYRTRGVEPKAQDDHFGNMISETRCESLM